MTIRLGIFIITAFVFVLVVAIALCRAASLGDEAQRLARRVTEDEARARLMADELDTTRFYGDDAR
jgi:hypothetical protein